jgi:L-ornithine N5-oxygenase
VIGGGQSGAEIAYDLHQTFKNAKITCIYRSLGFKAADDSAFVNEMFDPDFVDFIYQVPEHTRQRLLTKHHDTNYSVVDDDLIASLYKIIYHENVIAKKRLHLTPLSNIMSIRKYKKKVKIDLVNITNTQTESLIVDAAVMATGYVYPNPPPMIESLEKYFEKGPSGKIEVHRHYGIVTDARLKAGIYLQGCNESTHGLSDTLLSILAIRSAEIFQHLTTARMQCDIETSELSEVVTNTLMQVTQL